MVRDVHTTAATLMAVLCAVVSLGMSWALMEWLAMVQAASYYVLIIHMCLIWSRH